MKNSRSSVKHRVQQCCGRQVAQRDDRAIGAAIGTAAHGICTASLVRQSEMQATVSSWAMAAAGVFTSLLAPLLKLFLR